MLRDMAKSVRLSDYLYEEVERLARAEKRSLANMLKVLLEQALQLPEQKHISASAGFITPQGHEEAARVMTGKTDLIEHFPQRVPRAIEDDHFKPDPK